MLAGSTTIRPTGGSYTTGGSAVEAIVSRPRPISLARLCLSNPPILRSHAAGLLTTGTCSSCDSNDVWTADGSNIRPATVARRPDMTPAARPAPAHCHAP